MEFIDEDGKVLINVIHKLWTDGMDKYSANYVWKNYFYFKKSGKEFEDLFNETYIIFHKCCVKIKEYKDKAQFVAYYKQALHNNMMEFKVDSIKDTDSLIDGCVSEMHHLQDTCNANLEGFFRYLSAEAKLVIAFLFNSPRELLEDVGFLNHKSKGVFNNKKLCELLGYNSEKVDLVKETQRSLWREFE